jgi:hypothetical protein
MLIHGLCIPQTDENGDLLWSEDPVHPTYEGYNITVDLFEEEAEDRHGKEDSSCSSRCTC